MMRIPAGRERPAPQLALRGKLWGPGEGEWVEGRPWPGGPELKCSARPPFVGKPTGGASRGRLRREPRGPGTT